MKAIDVLRENEIPYQSIPWPDAPEWLQAAFIRKCVSGGGFRFAIVLMTATGRIIMVGDRRGNIELQTQYPETLDEEKRRIEETRPMIERNLQP